MGDTLFLAHRVPFPPNRGDKIRAHHLLRKLAKIDRVHVGCFAESEEDRAGANELRETSASHCIIDRTKPLVLAGIEAVLSKKPVSLTAFHSPQLARWVSETVEAESVSTIVIFSGQMGQYIPVDYHGRVIVDLCDVDSAKFEGYAEAGQRVWLNAREGRLLAAHEERLARRADWTILISDKEADLFTSRLQFPSMANVSVLGNGIDANFFDPASVAPHPHISKRSGPHFVFTGQMDYPPNETAILWAIEHLMPKILERYPSAELHVVGRSPTSSLRSKDGRSGVTIWGEVPDVRPFIAVADCVVAPLQIARGVQNKVLEAMAMAKPVLLTPQAATGIDAVDGEHWMLSEATPNAMMAKIEHLLSDENLAAQMGQAARNFVLENHDWEAMLAPLDEMLEYPIREAKHAA